MTACNNVTSVTQFCAVYVDWKWPIRGANSKCLGACYWYYKSNTSYHCQDHCAII